MLKKGNINMNTKLIKDNIDKKEVFQAFFGDIFVIKINKVNYEIAIGRSGDAELDLIIATKAIASESISSEAKEFAARIIIENKVRDDLLFIPKKFTKSTKRIFRATARMRNEYENAERSL
jgi:hypothetical protein